MASRLELQTKLESILGSRNVYYQPPENIKIGYPAIIYSLGDIVTRTANDNKYAINKCYEITIVDGKPDNPAIEAILKLPFSRYVRHYVSNNLQHDLIELYF